MQHIKDQGLCNQEKTRMATSIAVSGKGGSGKTTVASMIIRCLLERGAPHGKALRSGAILAVDADPNSCLALTLGIEPARTIAEIREEARGRPATNTGGDRLRTFEYGIQQAIREAKGYDLLTMGRPEGPDCYCAANNMLRQFMDKLNSQYKYVIIDNEAGMEHLSRRTTNNVDLLLVVADATPIGIITAKRILGLANELPITVKDIGIVWNRTDAAPEQDSQANGMQTFGCVPADQSVLQTSMKGKSIFELDADSPALSAVREILDSRLEKLKD